MIPTPGFHLIAHRQDRDGQWLDQVEHWMIEHCGGTIQSAARGKDRGGREGVFIGLHPAAEDLQILDGGEGRVILAASTAAAGPGYHAYVCQRIKELGLAMQWTWRPQSDEVRDSTGYFFHGDIERAEGEMLRWLQAVARHVRDGAAAGGRDFALSMPAEVQFHHDDLMATPLGPRGAAWIEQVADDPQQGRDVFPWWSIQQDAHYWLNRALCLMWSEVRWRAPLDEEERNTLRNTQAMLTRARELDESLDYPYAEWDELHRLLAHDDPLVWLIRSLAQGRPSPAKPIGYRRRPVLYQPFDGWLIEISGSMSIASEQEGNVRVMRDIGRTARLSAIRGTLANGGPAPAPALLQRFSKDQGGEALAWQDGQRLARGEIARDQDAWTLQAVTATLGHVALLTVSWTTEADRPWALDLWSKLRRTRP